MNSKTRIILCLLATVAQNVLFSQQFTFSCQVEMPSQKGLHKVCLPPEIRKRTTNDLHDLRLFDKLGNEIPYVLNIENSSTAQTIFRPYPLLSQHHEKKYSELVFENNELRSIDNVALELKNSDADKFCAIEGSNDRRQWYSVSAKQQMALTNENRSGSTFLTLRFPTVQYKYMRLLIDNLKSGPYNITGVGAFEIKQPHEKLIPVALKCHLENNRKSKTTLVKINAENQQLDRITFDVRSPRLFRRPAQLFKQAIIVQNRKKNNYEQQIADFELGSDQKNSIQLNGLREQELFVRIDNGDNQPLQINEVRGYQHPAYLLCDLDSATGYYLKGGNTLLPFPRYDLGELLSNATGNYPELNVKNVAVVPIKTAVKTYPEESFIQTKIFMWLCIGAAVLVLLFFARSLLLEMRQEKSNS